MRLGLIQQTIQIASSLEPQLFPKHVVPSKLLLKHPTFELVIFAPTINSAFCEAIYVLA